MREIRRLYDELRSRPCQDCGRSFPGYCMALDHTRGVTMFRPSTPFRGRPKAGRPTKADRLDRETTDHDRWRAAVLRLGDAVAAWLEEMEKVDVVCPVCDQRRKEERRRGLELGSLMDDLPAWYAVQVQV